MKRRMTLLVFMPLMAVLVFSLIRSTTALGEVVGDDNRLAKRAEAVNTTLPGALILVAGHLFPNDPLQANIDHVTDTTYQLFRSRGYMDSDIFYLINNPATGQDALPTLDNLHLAITEWAVNRVGPGQPLTIYLMGHGRNDAFILNRPLGQYLTPGDLSLWLGELEFLTTGLDTRIVVDQAYAGIFIASPQPASAPGRVVVTSASASGLAWASENGALFSDAFISALSLDASLWSAFQQAQTAIYLAGLPQEPWLDANGNGIWNEPADEQIAAQLYMFPAPTPTPSATTTPSPTVPSTPSATPTWTPSPTHTATPTPSPTPTPTVPPGGDPYEPDNTCSSANALAPNGSTQERTFHAAGDLDWVRFNATANRRYVITARAVGPLADLVLTPYRTCDDPTATPRYDFGRDVVLTWIAASDGPIFLRLENHNPAVFGAGTEYQISVREVNTGAAIVVGGRQTQPEALQSQITFMTNRAYQTFFQAGYDHGDIYYLSADPTPQPHVDGPSVSANLHYALATWAAGRVQDGDPLYVYLSDHGQPELFFVNVNDVVTTAQLESWLLAFEQQRPNSPVVVIIEACKSGSLITPIQTLAKPGRIVITATGDNNDAYALGLGQGGGYFSDPFFSALAQDYSLWDSYQMAASSVLATLGTQQTPWIDGDGDGIPFPIDTDDQGAGRHLGLGRIPGFSGQAPYIEPPTLPTPAGSQPVTIRVQVLDESRATTTVWMEVTRPSTPPPSPPPGYTTPVSHAERVNLVYNPATDRFQVDFAFDEVGVYQFVFQAEDGSGQRAQPVVVTVRTGGKVYLPLILR